jgi:hypothetical protein
MAVTSLNGNLYDSVDLSFMNGRSSYTPTTDQHLQSLLKSGYLSPLNYTAPQGAGQSQQGASMYKDPFGTAMSGTQKGTLQPFINRNTQQSSNALYGGLLGYQPQSMIAGDAGGTPQNSAVPNWRMPSAIPQPNQAQIGLLGPNQPMFGNRSWMGGQ